MTTPTFDPSQCKWGTFPTLDKPTVRIGSSNNYCGYLMGVLRCKCGRTEITVHPLPGPWYFNGVTQTAVKDLQRMFGLYVDGIVGPQTWPVVDYLAVYG